MEIKDNNGFIYITNGNLKIVLSCLGAAITEISFDDDLLTLTPINYQDLTRENIYYGKTIGPIANRIKDGLVKIENKSYFLSLNEVGVSNHSGKNGISNKEFDHIIKDDKVIFEYKENIFDGVITYNVIYSFASENEIKVEYVVRTTNRALLSLTNHTFFTLGQDGIDNLSLKLGTSSFIESDKETLVPQSVKPIIKCLDFNKEKLLVKDIDDPYLMNHRTKGYDHCFLLNKKVVMLNSPKYSLIVASNFPCVHIYSDNYADGVLVKNTKLTSRRAVAIEPEDNLLEKTLITKDEIYQRYITYTFLKR